MRHKGQRQVPQVPDSAGDNDDVKSVVWRYRLRGGPDKWLVVIGSKCTLKAARQWLDNKFPGRVIDVKPGSTDDLH